MDTAAVLYSAAPSVIPKYCKKHTFLSGGLGGGVRMTGGLLERSLISGNAALNMGGGVYLVNGTVRNCVIVNNSADGAGGGVYIAAGSGVVQHCTIVGNNALGQGMGVFIAAGNGSLRNSIVRHNGIGYDACNTDIHQAAAQWPGAARILPRAGPATLMRTLCLMTLNGIQAFSWFAMYRRAAALSA